MNEVKTNGIPIVFGDIVLVRKPIGKGNVQPLNTVVKEVVFRDCEESYHCPVVLKRAIKQLPLRFRKLEGWQISALHPSKLLGFSVPNNIENADV